MHERERRRERGGGRERQRENVRLSVHLVDVRCTVRCVRERKKICVCAHI